jgi:hypothetical protein
MVVIRQRVIHKMRRKGVFSGKNPREEDSHEENPHEENPWEGKAPRRSDEESPTEPSTQHQFQVSSEISGII